MHAATIVLAAEAEREGLALVLPDTAELVWGVVGFAILAFVIFRFAIPPLNRMLEERQRSIVGRMEEAERVHAEAEGFKRQYEEQLADARSQANAIVEDARSQAERVRADTVAKAEEEAAEVKARAAEDLEAERGRLVQGLRAQVAALSVELAGRIVERELDEQRHRDLIDEYIADLSRLR